MEKKAQASHSRPCHGDFVYGMAAPYSFLDIFAYIRLGGSAGAKGSCSQRQDLESFGNRKWDAKRSQSA